MTTRFFEPPYQLKTGKPVDAARGLQEHLTVDLSRHYAAIATGVKGIEQEVAQYAAASAEGKEVLEMLNYILYETTSEKRYANGIRDEGRGSVTIEYFLEHDKAQDARLKRPEVVALRLYTTLAYKAMNNPLRDSVRRQEGRPCPLPVATHFAAEGIKKLRALRAGDASSQKVVLWRGMRTMTVTPEFLREGGTELAFMSTTTDLEVSVRYALSGHSLLFKIVPFNFMSIGAELQWLSAFPGEAEILYPPLTFLQPTGRTQSITVPRQGGAVSITVVEVVPSLA